MPDEPIVFRGVNSVGQPVVVVCSNQIVKLKRAHRTPPIRFLFEPPGEDTEDCADDDRDDPAVLDDQDVDELRGE